MTMKKIVVVAAAFAAFSFAANAQEAKPVQEQTAQHDEHNKKDEIAYKNGKLTQRVNGVETAVEKDITLKNGAVVSPNGTLKAADGTTTALKEGDVVSFEGKVWNKKEGNKSDVMKGEVK